MNIIYLGTPQFAVPVLQSLIDSHHKVVGVVTQPDKPVGRKQVITAPPVKVLALENNIPVFQFKNIKKEGVETLKSLNADIMVTCAYGQILNQEVLDITPFGVVNVHGSILPKYRGASPIQCAIINGETITGVTILQTQVGLDDGPTMLKAYCDILQNDTTTTLLEKVSLLGASVIVNALDQIENGKAIFTPQNASEATYYKMFKKEDGLIDFNKSAKQISDFIRGINPWPNAYFDHNGQKYKVFKSSQVDYDGKEPNGTILYSDSKNGLIMKCDNGAISIDELQAPSSKRMITKSYLNGKKI